MSELREKTAFNTVNVRNEFPILKQRFKDQPLIYLDSAATSQKPQRVIDAVSNFYETSNANVHRGIYELSHRATARYEAARQAAKNFINAARNHEIIFTRGTTESINLVAQSFGRKNIKAGDEIIISTMEHHSNIVPWQVLCESVGAILKVIPISDEGVIDLDAFESLLNEKTKLVSIMHISNVLGTINPIKQIIKMAHLNDTPVLVDGAQAIAHAKVDVQDLDADFYVFSSHKMYGPTGVGVLYGKEDLLEEMPPYQTGGDMIKTVTFEKTEFNMLPHKFEAGTPNSAGVVGFGEAIHFLQQFDPEAIIRHENHLLDLATSALSQIDGLQIIGTAAQKSGVISFVMSQAHPHDISTILDSEGVAIRAGHHCAMPLMQRLGVPATARVSFSIYNNEEDVTKMMLSLQKVVDIFKD